jgi:AbrB family transcriptional regulator, stage V sporulation protein T
MKATGVVRRIDDLGRVVIPKEIRRNLRIREGENLEIYVDNNSNIILRKHALMNTLEELANKYVETVFSITRNNVLISNRDLIVAVGGPLRKKYLGKPLSENFDNLLLKRDNYTEKKKKEVEFITNVREEAAFSSSPILINGDAAGMVIMFSNERELSSADEIITQIIAQILGRYAEE